MNKVYLLLGSNQEEPQKQLAIARRLIQKDLGRIDRMSSIYQTAAWGKRNQPDFLNQVLVINTESTAEETMQKILSIEEKMGRKRTVRNAPRIIDIDILFFNKLIANLPHLQIPHPRMAQRRFVLTPLNQLSPMLRHPVLNISVHQMLLQCNDPLDVKRI
jgi:2-amino-4-hydroxy-6-hydroxymethyldihydropteridine diphosphokinase